MLMNMDKYVFRDHSPKYKSFFEFERKKIAKILLKAKVEHVGSTAISGLGGKGIIDIMIGVPK